MEIRYHLDEHVNPAIASGLRRRGIDVSTTLEAGLTSAEDEEHIAYALAESRVIVTHDEDFLKLAAEGIPHAGIAYAHQQTRSIGKIIKSLVRLWENFEQEEMHGRVEFI